MLLTSLWTGVAENLKDELSRLFSGAKLGSASQNL
jgi:hypothetical protein